jgi:tyrosine-protein kinase Etk/Wzc
MSTMTNLKNEEVAVLEDDTSGMSLMDLLLVLVKHKKLIFVLPVLLGVIGLGISFLMPNVYKANTKILPPQQSQSTAAAMLSQLGGLAGGAGAALGVKNPNDIYIGMLKSRAITDKLIVRFDLQKIYEKKLLESTRKEVAQNVDITSGKDGIINIEFQGTDPKLVTAITNAYVEELVGLTGKFFLTEASHRRAFFEKQLLLAKDNLVVVESNLTGALESKGMISVDAQSKVILETVARLRAGITAKEIQLKSMQAFVTENNTEYKRTNQEIISKRHELEKLENGNPDESLNGGKLNRGGLANIQILRDVKYNTMLYELLAKQYEVARLDEAKDIPMIQVLDVALVPERKFKPQRAMIAILSAFLGLFIALIYAFVAENMKAPKTAEQEEKWRQLRSYLKFR